MVVGIDMGNGNELALLDRPLLGDGPVVRQVFRILRDAIVSLRLAPGDKLSEQLVARQLGISRQPVREALIRLAETGLVRVLPQRGTLVQPLSVADILDAHFVRDAVEGALVREAALRMDAPTLRRFREVMAAQRRAARTGDGDAFFAEDEAFHRLVAEAAGRLAAWRVVEDVKPRLDRVRFVNMGQAGRRGLVLRQHGAVVQALADRDPDAAAAAMRAHLANVPDSLPDLVRQRPHLFGPDDPGAGSPGRQDEACGFTLGKDGGRGTTYP